MEPPATRSLPMEITLDDSDDDDVMIVDETPAVTSRNKRNDSSQCQAHPEGSCPHCPIKCEWN